MIDCQQKSKKNKKDVDKQSRAVVEYVRDKKSLYEPLKLSGKAGILMTNETELRIAMFRARTTVAALAKALGVSVMTVRRKINGKTEFKASEIVTVSRVLSLSAVERDAIFFFEQ